MRTDRLKMSLLKLCVSAVVCADLFGCSATSLRVARHFNLEASLRGSLPWNPLQGRVITTWTDPSNSTMSTLYGNDVAIGHARSVAEDPYPIGTSLALVTWKQQEDERWFGAKIPTALESVEFIAVERLQGSAARYVYTEFRGSSLQKTQSESAEAPTGRAAYILSQHVAPMP